MGSRLTPEDARAVARILYAANQRHAAELAADRATTSGDTQAPDHQELGGRS